MKKISVILFLLIATKNIYAQSSDFNTILYGAAYYHEYMPYDRLDKDVQMMQEAGISVVRLGESSWGLFEPREGIFDFAWMDRIIDKMQAAGIKVIFGTPTYSIPAWMAKKHPEILTERLDGSKVSFGIRQNADITNPTYLFYAERIIRQLMQHYAKHPAIIGFQVDNETSTYGAANYDVQRSFVDYMKRKYKTIDSVNKAWGLNYWGMRLNDWDEFPDRKGTTNPSYKLEWDRFALQVPADFLTWQANIVNEYKRPGQFVTQCFMPWMVSINQYAACKNLTMPSLNIYHGTQNSVNGEDVIWCDDFFRSIKKSNYLITETNAQAIGWDAKGQYPPFDGQPRLFTYSHLASGANMVEYWHWHSIHNGQETYWKGILGHDLEPNRFYNEVKIIAHELKKIGPELVNLRIKNKVAILYSQESETGLTYLPFKDGDAYLENLRQMHRALVRQNIGVDFVFAQDADFSGYQLLLVPSLYIANDSLLHKISDFVKNGGHVIMAPKSGFCNEYSGVRYTKAPGPLRAVTGIYYQEFSSISNVSLTSTLPAVEKDKNKAVAWAEYITAETARTLVQYNDSILKKYPAVTENTFGKGTCIYEGCLLTDEMQEAIITQKAKELKLVPEHNIPYPVMMRYGTNAKGKTIRYYLNYSGEAKQVNNFYKKGINLLTTLTVNEGDKIELQPWGVAIIEE